MDSLSIDANISGKNMLQREILRGKHNWLFLRAEEPYIFDGLTNVELP